MRKIIILSLMLAFAVLLTNFTEAQAVAPFSKSRPKLILLLVVDQFRADYLLRFEGRFQENGFKFLMHQGAYYPYGQYDILQSMTGPGHATISTGAYPYQMGIPSNTWFDYVTQQKVYCVEDASEPLIGALKQDPHAGTSPKNLWATTFGDELKNAGYPSRIVSVSLKDRAAILLGGHRADLALWFDANNFNWVSSRYYLHNDQLPDWVVAHNSSLKARPSSVWASDGAGSGFSTVSGFSHPVKWGDPDSLATPLGVELTEQMALRALDQYKLGQGKSTDVLTVSFSTHDYAGHRYGPNAREMEELTVAEDASVARILGHLKKTLPGGLDDVVVVLTGDHGMPTASDYTAENHEPGGRLSEADLSRAINEALEARFGTRKGNHAPEKWVAYVSDLAFYLDHSLIAQKKLKLAEVQSAAKNSILQRLGVAHIVSAAAYEEKSPSAVLPGMFERQLAHTFIPQRSADLIVVPRPYFMAGNADAVSHHTSYAYDRTVPIILFGNSFKKGVYSQAAQVIDIAPTLSFISGTIPPAATEGRVLSEALN